MDREEVLDRLEEAVGELVHLLGAVPEEFLSRSPDGWSPREVVVQLAEGSRHLARAVRELLGGHTAGLRPEAVRQADPAGLRSQLEDSCGELVALLRELPEAVWLQDPGTGPGSVLLAAGQLTQAFVAHTERLRAWGKDQGVEVPRRSLLRTPLHRRHRQLGARMVPFAGWEMPVQYQGIVAEHQAVRARVGLFDVSHMGELEVAGPGALATLDRLLCNDPRRMSVGQAMYTPMCREDGGVLDDLVAMRLGPDRFLLVVNAARREQDAQWVRQHAQGCQVEDVSFSRGLVALQGPQAQAVLQRATDADLAPLGRFRVLEGVRVAGVRAVVSRTGYTGEDGFEILTDWHEAERVWDALLELGALPCGLGARDTLRLEAGYLLYGADLDESTTPLEAGLGWTVKLEGREFVGASALRRQKQTGPTRRLCGLVLEGRTIARAGCAVLHQGEPVGRVTSGTFGPWVQRSIALAYLPAALAAPGTRLAVQVRAGAVPAEVVRLPFYRRPQADPV